jgi:beta-galactosidase/beta-glucuronidase
MTIRDTTTLHPRPQLARRRWQDLRGAWEFCYDDDGRGLDEAWQDHAERFSRTIVVPFPPESRASGIGDCGYHPHVWYRHQFTLPDWHMGDRVLLHFGAVDYRADVWLDGRHVATHEGGHTPFAADVTAALAKSATHVVVVHAQDEPLDVALPRGKQDWREEPHAIWYNRTTGIWQPVWLELVGQSYVSDLRWTPDLERGTLGLAALVTRHDNTPLRARVRMSLDGRPLIDDSCSIQGTSLRREFALDLGGVGMEPEQILWTPEHPNLIEAEITLLSNGTEVDEVYSYAGLRSVTTGNDRFWLNGRPYFLRMALEQGYWPDSHLASPSDDALREEVELARSLGFNGVRIHQKVEDPRFLYWCDRLGLLVWVEMPSALVFSETAVERLTREWIEVVRRDYSHPCIVAWVPFNESWGVPSLMSDTAQRSYIMALYHLTHALDRTRPVVGNDGWEHADSDILTIHDYAFHGVELKERYGAKDVLERTLESVQPGHHLILLPDAKRTGQPVMITEFGGISLRPDQGDKWFGYGTVGSTEEFEQKYAELVGALASSPAIAGFCYTQLTDTLQETNGLATARRVPKADVATLRSITRHASRSALGDEVNEMREAVVTTPAASQEASRPSILTRARSL